MHKQYLKMPSLSGFNRCVNLTCVMPPMNPIIMTDDEIIFYLEEENDKLKKKVSVFINTIRDYFGAEYLDSIIELEEYLRKNRYINNEGN